MTANISNINKYQQINQIWKNNQTSKNEKNSNVDSKEKYGVDGDVELKEWTPININSSLVPTVKEGYGTVIGDVNLSDDARKYYDTLKNKFSGMDFILVSTDLKQQVKANASQYGNASKPVVLIDAEKIERMATDESYRKKYEGLIAMAQMKLQDAKNSLASSGANVKNFGLSVNEDGSMSFFATIEKAGEAQKKRLEKHQAAKKEEKIKEKKQENKAKEQERLEKIKEKNKSSKAEKNNKFDDSDESEKIPEENREYVEFSSTDIDALIKAVSKYAYNNSFDSIRTEAETMVGQNIDFKG